MGWVKVSDDFYDHGKFAALTALGDSTWIRGLAHANRNLTDGFISTRAAMRLVDTTGLQAEPAQGVAELVEAGLWDTAPGGYQIHDYLDYQLSKADIQVKATANRERVRAYAERRKQAESNNVPMLTPESNIVSLVVQNPVNNVPMAVQSSLALPHNDAEVGTESYAKANALATPPLHTTPTPTPTPLTTLCSTAAPEADAAPRKLYSDEFESFWKLYPRKQSKGDAWKAWEVARKRKQLPVVEVLAGVAAYAALRKGEDPTFTKLPAGWLRDRKWEDDNSRPGTAAGQVVEAGLLERRAAMGKWLAERGVTLDEYDRRKAESGWLESLKGKGDA